MARGVADGVGVGFGVWSIASAPDRCISGACAGEVCALPGNAIPSTSSTTIVIRERALEINNRISLEGPDHAGGHSNAGNDLNVLSGILEDAAPSNFVGNKDSVAGLKQRVDHAA